jgi:hypothetical protein
MKYFTLKKIIPFYVVLTFLFLSAAVTNAEEKPQIVYAGIAIAGGAFSQIKDQFPYLTSGWGNGQPNAEGRKLRDIVSTVLQKTKCNFDLLDVSGINKKKEFVEIENPLSLTVLITRESLYKDEYSLKISGEMKTYVKYYFDVGLSAILFSPTENKDKIEYAIPVIAEDILLGPLTEEQKKDQFFLTFNRAVKLLFRKIEKLNPRQVVAQIVDISGTNARINAGRSDGILKGIFVTASGGAEGIITEVARNEAYVNFRRGKPLKGDVIRINVCKSEDEETFQVINVTITSKKAKALLEKDHDFEVLCAQWFSDYLSDRGGVIVLPPKTGAAYTTGAKESLISAYNLEGSHYEFEIPDAKMPIVLDINGLAKKMIKGNNINQIWIYKAWIEQDIGGNKKEVSEFVKEQVVVGVKEVNDYQVFREVIQQTLAKLAKE